MRSSGLGGAWSYCGWWLVLRLGGSFNRDFEGARPPKGCQIHPSCELLGLQASIFRQALPHDHSLRRHIPIGFA